MASVAEELLELLACDGVLIGVIHYNAKAQPFLSLIGRTHRTHRTHITPHTSRPHLTPHPSPSAITPRAIPPHLQAAAPARE